MAEPNKDHKVKGTLLVALAMVINASKNVDWSKETVLTEEDLMQIKKGIMAFQWYDRGLWERMSISVYRLVGKSNPEMAYQFGKGVLADSLLKIYQGSLVTNDFKELTKTFAEFYGTAWFNFGQAEFTLTEKEKIFKIYHPEGIPIQECFIPMVKGVVTRLIESNGGKNVRVECEQEKLALSQKLDTVTFHIYWD